MQHAFHAVAITILGTVLATGDARADSYAAACAARKGVPVSDCTCEGKIVESLLDPIELRTTILILRGRAAQVQVLTKKMGERKVAALARKMDLVSMKTDATCR